MMLQMVAQMIMTMRTKKKMLAMKLMQVQAQVHLAPAYQLLEYQTCKEWGRVTLIL